jgi:hypothetical protein
MPHGNLWFVIQPATLFERGIGLRYPDMQAAGRPPQELFETAHLFPIVAEHHVAREPRQWFARRLKQGAVKFSGSAAKLCFRLL